MFKPRTRRRADIFAFRVRLVYSHRAELLGILDGERIRTLAQYLEARSLPFFHCVLFSQRVLLNKIDPWSATLDSLYCSRVNQVELVLRRDGGRGGGG